MAKNNVSKHFTCRKIIFTSQAYDSRFNVRFCVFIAERWLCSEGRKANVLELETTNIVNPSFPNCICSARPTGGRNEINLVVNGQPVALYGPSKPFV